MRGRFIGLGGLQESGKDATADHLVSALGFTKVGMSDVLLEACLALDPWVPINAQENERAGMTGQFVRFSWLHARYGYVKAKENPEFRGIMRRLGTEVGRDIIGETTWTDIVTRRIAALLADGRDVVLTGVRYSNENALVRELGGVDVWVDRPGHHTATDLNHSSENSVSAEDFSMVLVNDSSLDDLKGKAIALAEGLAPAARDTPTNQKVLVDGQILMDLAAVQPADKAKAIVESFPTGPLVIERSRITPVV